MDANALDRDVCREHLAEVLAEEAALLGELRTLLEREYEVLGTKDAIAVEKTVLARQERVGALARVEEHRRSLCSLHGYSADYAGLEGLIVWCDPQGTLVSRLRECAKRAADCRDLNERNGTLVAAKLKRVEGLLGALTGRTSSADTYNANGSNAPTRPGRVLGAA
ncbi:MAG TPA: flagellar protein FlgN [Steroidobacteraceae bacterium]|nr:flagellar protein FlgN [Steroidobacteraceae bacterium]